jgi:hypothetical protein
MRAQVRVKHWAGIACAFAFWMAGAAHAQTFGGSLTVENSSVLTDVIGRTLPGTFTVGGDPSAVRVEIRETNPAGGIAPPDPETGEGNEGVNPLVRESYMGAGIIVSNPGRFSELFGERLDGAKQYYVRVYDQPSTSDSLYYRDSSSFQDNGVALSVDPVFGGWKLIATAQPDVDSDGDGVPDALEELIGTIIFNADTDGDGYGDLFEHFYSDYMRPMEPDPPFVVELIPPVYTPAEIEGDPMVQEGPHTVSWFTVPVPGLYYRLEWIDELPFDEALTQTIWDGVLAQPGEQVDVDVEDYIRDDGGIRGFFRVWAETP